MNFGQALTALYQGKKVAREVWKNKGLWVELQVPDANGSIFDPSTECLVLDNILVVKPFGVRNR